MRRPSTRDELYAWHRAMLRGERPATIEGHPECGWFSMRFKPGAPLVPASIWCEQDIDPETGELASPEVYHCEIKGESRDPYRWFDSLKPISRAEYDALVNLHLIEVAMAATHVPFDYARTFLRP